MYKKILPLIAFVMLAVMAQAQNAMVKKAAQATFSLNTFRADGTPLATSHGVFVSNNGDAIAQWKPFVGAAKAVVIDSKGKKYDVEGLIGANDIYDVCKFHVKGMTDNAPVAKTMVDANGTLWLASYSVKGAKIVQAKVAELEKFSIAGSSQQYPFYILNVNAPDDVTFCPVINESGEIAALLQSAGNGTANAVSALYPTEMQMQQLGDNTTTLAQSLIAPMLPTDYSEAQLALMLASQHRQDEAYKVVVEQFIKFFPQKPDGYQARARILLAAKDFQAAKADMEKSISVADDKADAHNAFSNLILDKEIYMADETADGWTLDNALNEAKQAYATSDLPIYLQQQGKVLFMMQKYDEAYNVYMQLQQTNLAGPETMYAAVQCRKAANAPLDEIVTLMDSTIAVCPHPLTFQSAPYVFQRGAIYQEYGQYRKAINDFNAYEKLMVGNFIPAEFYYNRFICEREGRVFQQALDDITKATELDSANPDYFCELGSLQLRLKMNDEAIASANKALLLDRRHADAYAVLGVAQCTSGKKHEGLLNLEEAKSLGYEPADELIKKYK